MKKQINPTIKAHLIRGAFYLLLLVAVCAIPFALAQRSAANRGAVNSASKPNMVGKPAPPSAAARASKLSGVHSKVASQPKAGSQLLPYDVRGLPDVPGSQLPRLSAAKLANALLGRVGKDASVKGNNPLLTYVIDDGMAEDSIGLTAGGTFVSCNEFPVTGGNNMITSISIAWGTPAFPDPTLNGLAYTAVLWSDPNGDGSPTDAVVLAMAPGVISMEGTNTFLTTVIPPTLVTTPNFFVGFLITHVAGQFPAAFDETAPLPNRSWIALTSSINDLSGAAPIESFGLVGNWLIRAEGQGGGIPRLRQRQRARRQCAAVTLSTLARGTRSTRERRTRAITAMTSQPLSTCRSPCSSTTRPLARPSLAPMARWDLSPMATPSPMPACLLLPRTWRSYRTGTISEPI